MNRRRSSDPWAVNRSVQFATVLCVLVGLIPRLDPVSRANCRSLDFHFERRSYSPLNVSQKWDLFFPKWGWIIDFLFPPPPLCFRACSPALPCPWPARRSPVSDGLDGRSSPKRDPFPLSHYSSCQNSAIAHLAPDCNITSLLTPFFTKTEGFSRSPMIWNSLNLPVRDCQCFRVSQQTVNEVNCYA